MRLLGQNFFSIFHLCAIISCCYCIKNEKHIEKIYIEKKSINDLDTSATGYIYRSDGNGPPMFIKLGQGNIDQYEKVFKNSGLFSHDKNDYNDDSDTIFPKIHSKAYLVKESPLKSFPYHKSEKSKFPAFHTGKFNQYKVKDEENYEYSQGDGFASPEYNDYQAELNGGSPDTGPITFFKKAAGYKEQSQMYITPNKHNFEKLNKGYIAPFFEAPNNDKLKFNKQKAPIKYPLTSLINFGGGDDNIEYDGEDTGHNSQYLHSDYHNHHPKKYHFKKGGGESHKDDHHASHGDKDESGYKKYHDFDEAEMGHHGKKGKKGYHKQESGYKKKHEDGAKKYGEHHEGEHGEKATKYNQAKGHKKGHKTKGYHNIFHKDEYKKEHKFYDDAHKEGHEKKHGKHHVEHAKKHGGKEKGSHYNSGYDEGHKGSSSKFKKGHFDNDHKGHKGESGHDSSYHKHHDYGKKGKHSEGEKHGYSESDKHGHGGNDYD